MHGCAVYGPKEGIFSMTIGSSMQEMILSAPSQIGQILMSMPNTRIRRCAPGHRGPAFGRRWLLALVGDLALVAPTSLGRCHQAAASAVRREYAMEARQVDSGLRHQCSQPGDEIQWLEDDMRCAILVRRFQWVADVATGGERETLFSDR